VQYVFLWASGVPNSRVAPAPDTLATPLRTGRRKSTKKGLLVTLAVVSDSTRTEKKNFRLLRKLGCHTSEISQHAWSFGVEICVPK